MNNVPIGYENIDDEPISEQDLERLETIINDKANEDYDRLHESNLL